MKVKVLQSHIDNGKKRSSAFCPINLALKDMGFSDAGTGVDRVYLGRFYWTYLDFKLPIEACKFINDFDNGNPVTPFEFDIETAGKID